jgi:radical SAM-linked protein
LKLMRVFFEKRDRTRYISHLDLTRCMTRAFARTAIPIWFTEGFNPHVYMTFALPIPLGVEGARESFDFKLLEDSFPPAEIIRQLNAALPPDLQVLEAAEAVSKPEAIAWGEYEIRLYDPAGGAALEEVWDRFLDQPTIPVEKKTKRKVQEIDLRPLLTPLSKAAGEDCLTLSLRLPAGAALNLNPNLVLGAFQQFWGREPEYVRIARTAILREDLSLFA